MVVLAREYFGFSNSNSLRRKRLKAATRIKPSGRMALEGLLLVNSTTYSVIEQNLLDPGKPTDSIVSGAELLASFYK